LPQDPTRRDAIETTESNKVQTKSWQGKSVRSLAFQLELTIYTVAVIAYRVIKFYKVV